MDSTGASQQDGGLVSPRAVSQCLHGFYVHIIQFSPTNQVLSVCVHGVQYVPCITADFCPPSLTPSGSLEAPVDLNRYVFLTVGGNLSNCRKPMLTQGECPLNKGL